MIQKFNILAIALILAVSAMAGGCMFPLASKSYTNTTKERTGNRVKYQAHGAVLLFSILPIGETLDIKIEREKMRKQFKCNELTNIDTLYYNNSLIIVGWEYIIIKADCVKAAPKAQP